MEENRNISTVPLAAAQRGKGMGTSSDGDRPWQSYNTVYTNAKAGMDGVDKEKVQRVVYEMSKGSKYFENEKRKEAFIKQKIENFRAQCAKLTNKDISHFQTVLYLPSILLEKVPDRSKMYQIKIAEKRILELEASRDLSKIWLHSDMDAFYAAVETLENPSLKEKPLAVGSLSMICTANYEARKFGVRAAMPGFIARKLCPDLIFVPTNFGKYTYYSELTRKVFQRYDPDFIAPSLDEAYINVTGTCNERGISSEEVAGELRNAIFEVTGLTCSAGVAPNRLLAKVCSDINKPNGQYILPNDRKAVMTFISSLPIRKIGGIGKVTEHLLRDVLGIYTCEEMLQKGAFLYALFSPSSTDFFLSVGLGLGGTDTPQHKKRKSISSERTFSATEDESLLFQKLADIAETLSNDMEKECLCGRTLTLKLKTASFEVRTRAFSLQKYISSKEDILTYASKLLKAELPLSLRLMGLRMSQFHDDKHVPLDPTQKTLTSYLISGDDASVTKVNESTGSEISDNYLLHEGEIDLSVDESSFFNDDSNISLPYELHDFLGPNQLASSPQRSSSNDYPEGIQNMNDACASELKPSNLKGVNRTANLSDDKAVLLTNQKVEPSWLNDSICSVCGIELPASFTEEKQEHSDYHLAEMLQEEESKNMTGNMTGVLSLQERSMQKPAQGRGGARKKQKSSPREEHIIPIDAFLLKARKICSITLFPVM